MRLLSVTASQTKEIESCYPKNELKYIEYELYRYKQGNQKS